MKRMTVTNINNINDALTNCCTDCTRGTYLEEKNQATAYGQGIVVGMVNGLMAMGFDFEGAIWMVKQFADKHAEESAHGQWDPNVVPEAWWRDMQ